MVAEPIRRRVLDEMLSRCAVLGWNEACLHEAAEAARVDPADIEAEFPGGAVDVIAEFYRLLDERLGEEGPTDEELAELRYGARVGLLTFWRITAMDAYREESRAALKELAMPLNAGAAGRIVFATADRIWVRVGDRSMDVNWYSKRAILSGVITSATLYWLQDESEGCADTRAFIDRRIADVMTFERVKAFAQNDPRLKPLTKLLGRAVSGVRAPAWSRGDFPGQDRSAGE